MEEFAVIKFDPTVEQLTQMAEAVKNLTAADLTDDKQLELVKETRLQLRTARTTIEKQGKAMRDESNKYNKAVIARENELIAIIEPEEKRLKALEDEAALIKVRKAREELLPMRREALAVVGVTDLTDEALLDLDNDQFIVFLNKCTADKNERDRQEIQAEKDRLAREAHLEQVRKDAEVAERNRIEAAAKADEERRINAAAEEKRRQEQEAQKIIDDARAEADRIKREEEQRIENNRRAEEARIKAKAEADAAHAANEKYLAWAKELGWTSETSGDFKTEHSDGSIVLWRKVGVYTPEK